MICTVGSTKGGVGKTTLSVNIAVYLARGGWQVLLVDGDEQGTAMAFTEIRSASVSPYYPRYTAIQLHGAAIRTQVRQLAPHYDYVIIDVGGRDSGSLRAALVISHLFLIPSAPRSFDLWGAEQTADLVREAREVNPSLRAIAILNGADATGKDNDEAMDALGDMDGLEVSPFRLGRRKAYPNAAAQGLGVVELADRSVEAADREFTALMASLFSHGPGERKTA